MHNITSPSGQAANDATLCLPTPDKRFADVSVATDAASREVARSVRQRQQCEVLRDDASVEIVQITNAPPAGDYE